MTKEQKKQLLEFGIEVYDNWINDNLFEVPDDEINEALKHIERMENELSKL